jgi:hypothetical protein
LDLCLCVVVVGVVVAGVLLVVGVALVVDDELLPHPATAAVLARTTTVVSMAVSDVLLMGRAPDLA